MGPHRKDKLLSSYVNGRNAARDGLTKRDMPEGLDDLEKVNWECGFIDFLAEEEEQEELYNEL